MKKHQSWWLSLGTIRTEITWKLPRHELGTRHKDCHQSCSWPPALQDTTWTLCHGGWHVALRSWRDCLTWQRSYCSWAQDSSFTFYSTLSGGFKQLPYSNPNQIVGFWNVCATCGEESVNFYQHDLYLALSRNDECLCFCQILIWNSYQRQISTHWFYQKRDYPSQGTSKTHLWK